MRFEAYYVVRPRPTLLARVAGVRDAVLLIDPVLWSRGEGGRTASGPAEWTEDFKLTYLLGLQMDYLGQAPENEQQREFQALLQDLLGPAPWGVEVFDRWWTVERFDGVNEDADEIVERASLEDVQKLKGPEPWMERLVEQKKRSR